MKVDIQSLTVFFLILFILRWSIAENGTSQVVLVVKSLLANAGDIRDVGLIPGSGDPLEEGMAIQPNNLAWRIPWAEEPGGHRGSQRVRYEWSHLAHVYRLDGKGEKKIYIVNCVLNLYYFFSFNFLHKLKSFSNTLSIFCR